jgi:hypothetical protein
VVRVNCGRIWASVRFLNLFVPRLADNDDNFKLESTVLDSDRVKRFRHACSLVCWYECPKLR